MGRGAISKKRKEEVIPDERDLRRALLNMENTLKNWTLHGQNLRKMVTNYCDQCRSMGKKQHTQLAYFFNTASNILDTIGSMTENTIINSVKFDKSKNLKGGSLFGNDYSAKVLRNKPPPALFPTRPNLDKYRAVFPGLDFNPGHVLEVENDNENMFMSDYPKYPESHVLAENPNLPMQTNMLIQTLKAVAVMGLSMTTLWMIVLTKKKKTKKVLHQMKIVTCK